MKGFYSPIEKLAEESIRPRGTGAEFMAELGKRPGFKQAEVEDRNLQALQSLPKMAREDFIANLKAQRPTKPDEKVSSTEDDTHHEEYTLPGGTNYREILLQHPHGSFRGVREHFGGTPNILASMRVKDRISPEGKKILHIDEIQSDWHTKGHRHGYSPDDEDLHDAVRQAERNYNLLKAKSLETSALAQGAENALKSDKPLYQDPEVRQRYAKALAEHNSQIMALTPQIMKADEAHRVAKDRVRNSVPDAPFKKNWHELALKRMIQHAAEKGYDELHITPGEEQAKRWGASGDSAKGFHDLYNKQMPQFLNKFGKQFGAQVRPGYIEKPDSDFAHRFAVTDYGEGTPEYHEEMAKMRTPTHRFDITPEMREHVLKNGMPLYAKGGPTGVSRETIKPVAHGIIKERVTVSPDMDMMQYELMSAKRFTKKVK